MFTRIVMCAVILGLAGLSTQACAPPCSGLCWCGYEGGSNVSLCNLGDGWSYYTYSCVLPDTACGHLQKAYAKASESVWVYYPQSPLNHGCDGQCAKKCKNPGSGCGCGYNYEDWTVPVVCDPNEPGKTNLHCTMGTGWLNNGALICPCGTPLTSSTATCDVTLASYFPDFLACSGAYTDLTGCWMDQCFAENQWYDCEAWAGSMMVTDDAGVGYLTIPCDCDGAPVAGESCGSSGSPHYTKPYGDDCTG